ncbi:MAG: hypothetical protein ACXVES_11615 [Actinomycetota bacterium]
MAGSRTLVAPSKTPFIAAGISGCIAAAYLVIVHAQDHRFSGRSSFIAGYLILIAALLVGGARVEGPGAKAALLAGASNSLVLLGFLGLFSIGVPLLLAAGIALPATARALSETPRPWGPVIVVTASLGAVAVILAGVLVTR